jgi:hypothetical protein
MDTIEITKRLRTVTDRMIEVKWDKLVAEGEKIHHNKRLYERAYEQEDNGDDYYHVCVNKITISMHYDFPFSHDFECQYDGLKYYDATCDCDKEVSYSIRICSDDKWLFHGYFNKTTTKEDVLAYFKTLPDTIERCQCKSIATHKGWCETCYIKRQNHPEDEESPCAICHDYEGVWIKTKCNHYFHYHCFEKISRHLRKCPLCRTLLDDICDSSWHI